MLQLLDIFFLVFHTAFTAFILAGWAWRRTRKLHLAAVALTTGSWFILGIWYGFGYCFCTEWHWQVREAMGRPMPWSSYIEFLVHELTGIAPDPAVVDAVSAAAFGLCAVLSLGLNWRDWRRKKSAA
jgi:hypothetical protein